MSGPLGTSGGGAAGVTSVTAGNGITVTGTTTPTIAASLAAGTGIGISGTTTLSISNSGVTSLAGTGVSVSAAAGAVTITAPVVAGGTGISVSGSQTTSLTVTNSGVTALAGTGISVSAATGSVTVTPTYAAPTALTIGGTVATGAAASVSNSAHVHAMPGSAVAGASAVGDTAATGSATTVALSDHRHSREAFGTPGAVTGGATAASGSATTLARSDHVHSTASMPVLLASTTIVTATASYTLSSIPGTYGALQIIANARGNDGTAAFQHLRLQFNGDTASNYGWVFSDPTAYAFAGWLHNTSNFFASPATSIVTIAGYALTSTHKSIQTIYTANVSTTLSGSQGELLNIWRNTAAVTSLTLSPTLSSFVNTTIQVYGLP